MWADAVRMHVHTETKHCQHQVLSGSLAGRGDASLQSRGVTSTSRVFPRDYDAAMTRQRQAAAAAAGAFPRPPLAAHA